MRPDRERSRPLRQGRPSGETIAAESITTTLAGVLLAVEIDLTGAARKLEWLAVTEPDLGRESKIVYLSAARVRARRRAA